MSENDEIINDIAGFTHDPLSFVYYAYPWGEAETELSEDNGPRDWQSEMFTELGEHLQDPKTRHTPFLFSAASGHGIGKAHSVSMQIDTPKGLMRWGDLKPGDLVFDESGKPTKILAVKHYKKAPMYRVKFDDGSYCDVSSGHLWNVRGRQERRKGLDTWRTLETIEILNLGVKSSNGKALARQWEIPTQSPVQIKESKLPIHPYFLGIWLGDGSINKKTYTKPYMEVKKRIESQCGYKVNTLKQKYSYSVPEIPLIEVMELGSHQRYVPKEYKYSSIEQRKELLGGLLDADGEAHASGSIGFSSTSKQLAEDVVWLARSLGGKAKVQNKVKKGRYKKDEVVLECRDCYRATINLSWNPFTIKHKKEAYKVEKEGRYLKRWIDSIEEIGGSDAMCVEVENRSGLYLANDFIVTHNSAAIGMLTNWGLSTCEDCKIVITSNTETQLRTKTMPEIGKWFRLAINADWWRVTATAIFTKDKKHEKNWRADAVPWSKTNTEAFAGLHNKKKRIILIFDEASAIDDKVWEVAEGALTDEETEIIWVAFGNPTRNTGRFRECFRKFKHRWKNKQIDSRDVEGTNKQQIETWITDYGLNSDFVKVRVRGLFPTQSFKQFISSTDANEAYGRDLNESQYDFAPKILTLDPAWEGDDELVFGFRQGLFADILDAIEKNDNDLEVANHLMRLEDEHGADAVFIDAGYGTGIYSIGKSMGRNWRLVWFGGAASDKGCLNKRAEMWRDYRDWLKEGGSIPEDPILLDETIGPETVSRIDGKIQIESKKDMKARGLPSPNRADAIVLTFAYPVIKKKKQQVEKSTIIYGHGQGWMG